MGVKIIVAAQKQMGGRISCSAQKCNKSGVSLLLLLPPPNHISLCTKSKALKPFEPWVSDVGGSTNHGDGRSLSSFEIQNLCRSLVRPQNCRSEPSTQM